MMLLRSRTCIRRSASTWITQVFCTGRARDCCQGQVAFAMTGRTWLGESDAPFIVIPGLVPGIHVDGRDKPGHDGRRGRSIGRDFDRMLVRVVDVERLDCADRAG